MSSPTWVKALGIGALVAGAAGVASLFLTGNGEDGTEPPDEIEGEDDEGTDLPVEKAETVQDVFDR